VEESERDGGRRRRRRKRRKREAREGKTVEEAERWPERRDTTDGSPPVERAPRIRQGGTPERIGLRDREKEREDR
jgi:hypothetical protein